jgi:ParB-like nuclease domain
MAPGETRSGRSRADAAEGRSLPSCFDTGGAEGPTRVAPVGEIVDLLSITHAPDRIEDYRIAMERGLLFPPIAVVRLFGRLVVADGHKRLTACKAIGLDRIPVELWGVRRFVRDQVRQVAENARKNGAILKNSVSNPREAARLLGSTLRHWRRVAVCLASRLRSSRSG